MSRHKQTQPSGAAAPGMPTPAQIKVHQIKLRIAPLLAAEQNELAIALLEEVLPLDRRDGVLHKMLGFAYANSRNPEKGLFHLRRAVELGTTDTDTLMGLAGLYRDLGDLRSALRIVDRLLTEAPDEPKAVRLKAWVLRSMGDAQAALELIDRTLAENAWHPDLAFVRAEILRKFKRHGEAVDELKRLHEDPRATPMHRRDALFGLGHAYDAMDDYDAAFDAITRANATFEEASIIPFDEFASRWAKEDIDAMPEAAETTRLPVFIVGMPRSGTTLSEQILAAHPKVATVGESAAITSLCRDRFARDFDAAGVAAVAKGYLEKIEPGRYPKADRIVDKMPENFYFLPIIRKALPGATLIHCTRDARDTCLSCYFQHFGSRLLWSRRLETCARQYVLYRKIMDHWAEVLDATILENRYEDLTSDPEPRIRAMLDHAGLPFDKACLAHHTQKTTVQTASVDQVRNPIYTTSQQRWKRYEKHLGPMLEILEGY